MHTLIHPRVRRQVVEQSTRDRATIERLRAEATTHAQAQNTKPSVADVTTIVNDLLAIVPLADTAKKMPRANYDDQVRMVLDVIATFGTWLTHSQGASGVEVAFAVDATQLPLFQTAQRGDSDSADAPKARRKTQLATVPVGYEPSAAHRRDVTRALASVVSARPDSDVISRFVSRTYRTRSASLTYPLVAGVWLFAHKGRLDRIDRVSADSVFRTQVVAAYDLLDVARLDAIEAVKLLASRPAPEGRDELIAACKKSRWLAEQEIGRLERALTSAAPAGCANALEVFARTVGTDPAKYEPRSIAELSPGQVMRICAAAGLKVEYDTRSEETEIRAKLRSLGLSVDADRLVPEALRAAERGQLDEFWAIMQARVSGDSSWADQLEDLN